MERRGLKASEMGCRAKFVGSFIDQRGGMERESEICTCGLFKEIFELLVATVYRLHLSCLML